MFLIIHNFFCVLICATRLQWDSYRKLVPLAAESRLGSGVLHLYVKWNIYVEFCAIFIATDANRRELHVNQHVANTSELLRQPHDNRNLPIRTADHGG
jgi:hypothetical protein